MTSKIVPSAELINEALIERGQGAIVLDGFETAFLGFAQRVGEPVVAVYSYEEMIVACIKNDGMSFDEGLEFVESVMDGWSGAQTPIIVVNPFHKDYPYIDLDLEDDGT